MTSDLSDLHSKFLLKVESYKIASLDESIVSAMELQWLKSVVSRPKVRRLFSSMEIDEMSESVEYEMKYVVDEDEDKDFTEELLVQGMVVEWLSPYSRSELNAAQVFSNKETKYYSQQAHSSEMRELLKECKVEMQKLIRDRGYYHNSYLGGGS